MRNLIFLPLILSSVSAIGSDKRPISDDKIVLSKIQLVCLDVWCEDLNNFQFKKLFFNLSSKSTSIIFEMLPPDFPLEVEKNRFFRSSIEQKQFEIKCEINGFSNKKEIIDSDGSLNRTFYEALSDCILTLELPINGLKYNEKIDKGVFLDWSK